MHARYSEHTVMPSREAEPRKIANIVYQSATILAILLFLISFWSC